MQISLPVISLASRVLFSGIWTLSELTKCLLGKGQILYYTSQYVHPWSEEVYLSTLQSFGCAWANTATKEIWGLLKGVYTATEIKFVILYGSYCRRSTGI